MIKPTACEQCCGRGRPRSLSERFSLVTALALGLTLAPGCATSRPLPPADLSAAGWVIQTGQAVWKSGGSDLAGEIIFAKRDGSSALQFIKTPLPLVSAQTHGNRWTITFVADNRTVSGKGSVPAQLLWLHLASALTGDPPRRPLKFSRDVNGWALKNAETGESISGFLNQ
jgi:hypothetical protein